MKTPRPVTIDFETKGIERRPAYPPVPVGVSILKPGGKARYLAWGHASDNNCTREQAVKALREVWDCKDGLLFYNGKFDVDVAEVHLGLAPPSWERFHDTTFLVFLDNPHARTIDLKSTAHRVLGVPPDERDEVKEWLLTNQPLLRSEGIRITKGAGKTSKHPWGRYIWMAPGASVVGPYANGDVDRTYALFAKLYPAIEEAGMLPAYDRERRLMPILLDMERRGIPVDLGRLRTDVETYSRILVACEAYIKKRLGVADDPEFNINSSVQLVAALERTGLGDPALMGVTEKGNVKSDKAAIDAGVTDKVLAAALKYHGQLSTCLNTFMRPWLEVATSSGGVIYTNWNQTRGERGGTRTGRMSSSDTNFQNIPKEFDPIFREDALARVDRLSGIDREGMEALAKRLPECPFTYMPLPLCRGYIVPGAKKKVLVGRDYSQQEPRILGHFEDGELMRQYQADPWIDFHDNAKENLERIFNRRFSRKPVKNINLGIIYGQGVPSLAVKNGETVKATQELKAAILKMYPGLDAMYRDMRFKARTNEPIRTWGGRVYYCEPPILFKGRIITFDYKMVNVLIQGSAADCTKEAMLRFVVNAGEWPGEHWKINDPVTRGLAALRDRGWLLILQVHDEVVLIVPERDLAEAQDALRKAMESVEFDVPILSEGAYSYDDWASMRDWDKKGKMVAVPPPKSRAGKRSGAYATAKRTA